MKKEIVIYVYCTKTFDALMAICSYGCFNACFDEAKDDRYTLQRQGLVYLMKKADFIKYTTLAHFMEKHCCDVNGNYSQSSLAGSIGLKCREFLHKKARLNHLYRVFTDIAKDEMADCVIFKKSK